MPSSFKWLTLCWLLPLCAFAQHYTIISGTIKVPFNREVTLSLVTDDLTEELVLFSAPVASDGSFKLTLASTNPAWRVSSMALRTSSCLSPPTSGCK